MNLAIADSSEARRPLKRRVSPPTGWEAKLRRNVQPRVSIDPKHGDRVLHVTPHILAEEAAAIPYGSVMGVTELRTRLAARHGADRTCPLSLNAQLAVLAGCVAEDLTRYNRAPRWPIWRVVSDDGRLHKTWAVGSRWRASMLREEGLEVTRFDGTWKVGLV